MVGAAGAASGATAGAVLGAAAGAAGAAAGAAGAAAGGGTGAAAGADRYASSATQTRPLSDRPSAAARSCALALRDGGQRRGNDVVLIFISI